MKQAFIQSSLSSERRGERFSMRAPCRRTLGLLRVISALIMMLLGSSDRPARAAEPAGKQINGGGN